MGHITGSTFPPVNSIPVMKHDNRHPFAPAVRLLLIVFTLMAFFAVPAAAMILDDCQDHCEKECHDCTGCLHCLPSLPCLVGQSFVLPVASAVDQLEPGHYPHVDRVFATEVDRPPRPLLH